MVNEHDQIADALYFVPPYQRDLWVAMAMAIKNGMGEAGFDLWDAWSRQDTRPRPHGYSQRDAKAVWQSVRAQGKTTIASLFAVAQEHGWRGQAPDVAQGSVPDPSPADIESEQEREARAQAAAERAMGIVVRAEMGTHPYLASKGFPDARGLVVGSALLVPMRHHFTGVLQSLQQIAPDGAKKFLPGGRAGGAVFSLGRSQVKWWAEGYSTALSIQVALERLYRRDQVVICFSASNLANVARDGYVVADHDLYHCAAPDCHSAFDFVVDGVQVVSQLSCPDCGSQRVAQPAGGRYAAKTGLPFWIPPDSETDANDYMLKYGVEALADELRSLLRDRMV